MSESAVPRSSEAIDFFVMGGFLFFLLNTEIGMQLVHVRLQLGIGKTVDDLAMLDDVVAVRHRRREAEILLDQENGEPLLLQPRNGVADLLDDDGRKSFGR